MLWLKHHAWLVAIPKAAHEPKSGQAGAKPPSATRAENLGIDLEDTAMPPLVGGEWLIPWLFEAGPLASDGMGARGLSWPELRAWRDCTQALVTPWEMGALHRLSAAYAAAYHASQEPDCPAYWLDASLARPDVARSDAVGEKIKTLFGALAKPKPSKATSPHGRTVPLTSPPE